METSQGLKRKENVVGRGIIAINKAKGVYFPTHTPPELHISPCLSSQATSTADRSGPSFVLELNPIWQGQDRSLEEPRVFPEACQREGKQKRKHSGGKQ